MDVVDVSELTEIQSALKAAGAQSHVISKFLRPIKSSDGKDVLVDKTFATSGGSIMYDAVIVLGSAQNAEALKTQGNAIHFVNEAYKHGKAIGATGAGINLPVPTRIPNVTDKVEGQDATSSAARAPAKAVQPVIREFIAAVAQPITTQVCST